MRDLVLSAIGSFRGWFAWIFGGLVESMRDMLRLAICSWSPLELTDTWVFWGIVSGFCCTTPLEVINLYLSWPPLEVGVGYRSGANTCLGRTGVGCGNTLGDSCGKDFTVRRFANIVRTASIGANCESHMMLGTSLSAADKKCTAWVILYSALTWGYVRYACKYSAVSVIINDLVLMSIALM